MPATATYIYCLVESPRRPALPNVPRGLKGATTPDLLDIDTSLWAVTSEVPLSSYSAERLEERLRDVTWVADIAVAHAAVVEYVASRKRMTVVPMKVLTMFSSRDRAVADLRARRGDLSALLKRIRGCQEWGVRVTRRPASRPRGLGSGKATTGTAFLAAKIRARDDVREDVLKGTAAAGTVFRTLSRLARLTRRRDAPENAATPPLLDAAFLVPTAKQARFRSAVKRLALSTRRAGADLRVTGPWPAYNFVDSDEAPR
jgi:hypothetical protein